MSRPILFLSYSDKDRVLKDRMLLHLRILERFRDVEIVDMLDATPGDKWEQHVREEIGRADVALLFVSPDYLASDFITQVEFPQLLERHNKGQLVVIPVIARAAAWTQVPALRRLQAWPRDARPISEMNDVHLDRELADLAERISDLAGAISTRSIQTSPQLKTAGEAKPNAKSSAEGAGEFFISHAREDGDFAELLKLRMEKEGLTAWIDIERLNVGEDWRLEIDTAIRRTPALIVVVTPAARQSEYVTYEWAFAWGADVPVIPILLKETPMHPRLESLQYLDFTNPIARPWNKLLDALATTANRTR
jgi:hypothetical protein